MRPVTPAADHAWTQGIEPATYPELPDDQTAETAESFARSFERAYTRNALLTGTSTVAIPDGIEHISLYDSSAEGHVAGAGHLVEVSFSITYEDDVSDETPLASGKTPTPAPTGHTSVAASYYVTDRFALRRPERGGIWNVVARA